MNRLGALLASAIALSARSVVAQPETGPAQGSLTPAEERRAEAIARQTMSPFCPGRTLADCPSGYATEWRADIREMVAEGMSAKEIQATLEKRAGGNLSGSPHREAGYGLSAFFALLALAVLGAVFLRMRAGSTKSQRLADSRPSQANGDARNEDSPVPSSRRPQMVDEARLDAELAAEQDRPDE